MSRVVAIQMASGPNVSANLSEVERLIALAVDDGAKLVVLPENFAVMGIGDDDKVKVRETYGAGPIQDTLVRLASQFKIWIVGGTIPLVSNDAHKVRAACIVYDDEGQVRGRYDKIHLFDVVIDEGGEQYNESKTIESGDEVVVIDSPIGRLGIAVCYDLRFPEMFRAMLDKGVEVLVVPSAFTAFTGRAHWEVLVRARAIENLSYVVAAAQGGYHFNGRETYGNSMIVGPWGDVLDRLSSGTGIVGADIDLDVLAQTRKNFPAIDHRTLYCGGK